MSNSVSNNPNTSLREETLCPCPPETPSTDICSVTDGVDGGILPVIERLKEIKQQVSLINAGAYDASLLSDDQHYKLLDIEMLIDDFIAPYSYREVL